MNPGNGNRLGFPLLAGNSLSYRTLNASAAHWLSLTKPTEECKARAASSDAFRLQPKPSWRLRGQAPFSVQWYYTYSNTNSSGNATVSLEVKCRANASSSECAHGDSYNLSMRTETWTTFDNSNVISPYDYSEYPGTLPRIVDWIVMLEEDGISILWLDRMRHMYTHQLPGASFVNMQFTGPITATRHERSSYRRYDITLRDLNLLGALMPPGIYQLCFSPEGNSSHQTFLNDNSNETNIAYGTGISVTLHQHMTMLEVNGIVYFPRHHPEGIVATAPLRQGLIVRALGLPRKFNSQVQLLNDTFAVEQMRQTTNWLSLIAANGDCNSVDAITECVDGTCDNPPDVTRNNLVSASGWLAANIEDLSLRNADVLARLASGLYQACIRNSTAGIWTPSGFSFELHTRIGCIWINDANMHDGLHSKASRRDSNTVYIRGRLPIRSYLKHEGETFLGTEKSVPVSGRITLIPTGDAMSPMPSSTLPCARIKKQSVPYFVIDATNDTIAQVLSLFLSCYVFLPFCMPG